MRYFDPQRQRPGLPEHVAALVDRVGADGASLTLVNTDPVEERTVLLQAGSFAEHEFTKARIESGANEEQQVEVNDKCFQVRLGPAAQARLHLGLKRFVHQPTYEFPAFA